MVNKWYTKLNKLMGPHFSEEEFLRYLKRQKQKMPLFEKYVSKNSKILDIGCGFGYTSVPLSALGYDMTCIDIDDDVLKAIKYNAGKYGKIIKVEKVDANKIVERYGKDSFDVCISGGFLEHFSQEKIYILLEKQLKVAEIIFADVPIWSNQKTLKQNYKNYKQKICNDGIFRNLWDPKFWLNTVLKDFKIKYYEVGKSSKDTGNFEKLTFILER